MTLRDYFAAAVLQGMYANPHQDVMSLGATQCATWAYDAADAALKAREVEGE